MTSVIYRLHVSDILQRTVFMQKRGKLKGTLRTCFSIFSIAVRLSIIKIEESRMMETDSRNDDYQWFKDHQKELFKVYPNKFLIISGKDSAGAYDTFDEAMAHALGKFRPGTFLIQQCIEDLNPIQYYNRAVIFK